MTIRELFNFAIEPSKQPLLRGANLVKMKRDLLQIGFLASHLMLACAFNVPSKSRFPGTSTSPKHVMIPNNRPTDMGSSTIGPLFSASSAIPTNFTDNNMPIDNSQKGLEETEAKKSLLDPLLVLWRFTRPHTIIGSATAIPALHLLAAPSFAAALSLPCLASMIYAMVPSLFMNLYITGLNQVTDVEIDKINKPTLPIAAGDLSVRNGTIIVIASLILSLGMGLLHPTLGTSGLNTTLWFSGILGTIYSLPPFRLKRFPFLAAFCIVAVRGAVINAGFFAHAKVAAFGGAASGMNSVWHYLTTDPQCFLSSLYFAVFGVVIALMKDVPDVKGDEISNIRTFSVRLGQKRVFGWMRRLLTSSFVISGLMFWKGALLSPAAPLSVRLGRVIVGLAAVGCGRSVEKQAATVEPEDPKQVYNFYMHLWKLFYLSYVVLPFAR